MISVLSKPADEIGVADLQELIDTQVPEGEQIEFKERLPTDDGSPDRWVTRGDRIGRTAKHKILEEAVAFANASAGALILGIAESETKPSVAAEVCPIPQCVELAERLKLVFRDGVEPQVPNLEISAVPTDGDSGVVIIRVGKSRMAPHRVKPTRECTIRRFDRCDKMTMHEILDLTLILTQGKDRLKQRLADRQQRFPKEFDRLTGHTNSFGIRATAVPIVEGTIDFERVYGRHDVDAPRCKAIYVSNTGSHIALNDPFEFCPWKPRQRAVRSEFSNLSGGKLEFHSYQEIHCDGLIEFSLLTCPGGYGYAFYPSWLMIMFVTLATWADKVRNAASSPTIEYTLDIEICVNGEVVPVRCYEDDFTTRMRSFGRLGPDPIRLGYTLNESSEIARLAAVFEREFWNSIGEDYGFRNDRFILMPPEHQVRWGEED